jgi:hypothetical protein
MVAAAEAAEEMAIADGDGNSDFHIIFWCECLLPQCT